MKYFIIFGPPGAGKGTQSSLLIEKYGLKHVSTGQLLREEIEKGSQVGKVAKELIDKGQFVDDEIVLEIVKDQICNCNPSVYGLIFDGFPRTIAQAEALDKLLYQCNKSSVTAVMSLEVEDRLIVERIAKRAEIEGRKDDASIDTIIRRIKTYHTKTEPLITYYKEKGKYHHIKGDLSVDEIFKNICSIIERL
jgi:adenylate kinase